MKSSVETIRKCGQVARSVFAEVKSMVSPGEAGLEIAQDGVDPKEIRQFPGLSASGHGSLVMTARFGHSCEAGEPVGKHGATRAELGFGPVCDRLARKAGDHRQLEVQRVSTIVERDRRDKGHLVFRTPTDLATCAFSTQIGVVDLDLALERVECFALGHGLHELVMPPPGGGVADPQGPLQSQRGQACFRLADQIDRQKPEGQGQMRALEQGAGDERCLVPTSLALKRLARSKSGVQHSMGRMTALGAGKALGPAGLFDRCRTLYFGSELLEKVGHRQA